jgi:dihydrofolate reductase
MSTNIAKPFKISVIAAIGEKRELGFQNRLLWSLPEDLKRFKSLTTGHPVIMGLKTYHSIGRALPNRTNIVLSFEPQDIDGVSIAQNLDQAIALAKEAPGGEEIFIIGGGQVYAQAISKADKLYLTLVAAEAEADTFFPDYSIFDKKIAEEAREENGIKYKFVELER